MPEASLVHDPNSTMTHEGAPLPQIDPDPRCDAPAGPLADGRIDLVLAPHRAPAALVPALTALLTPSEYLAAHRYTSAAAQERAVVARATLRLLLSRSLQVAPQDLDIAADTHGKPFVRDADTMGRALAFNLSHAGDLLLYGFSRDPIGVDIELIKPIPRLDAFVRTALGARERAVHAKLPANQRLDHAYRVWVGKEALVKRSGEGIRRDFASFDLPERDVTIFVPQDGYIAAVAGQGMATLCVRRIADVGRLLPSDRTASRR